MKKRPPADTAYATFVAGLKTRIHGARLSAARAVNRELILLYWDIGQGIVEKQLSHGWGESVVEKLSRDIQKSFPGIDGFSMRNLWDMKRLHTTYLDMCADPEILRQLVAELARTGKRPKLKFALSPLEGLILQQPVAELKRKRKQDSEGITQADKTLVFEFLRQAVAEIPWGQNLLILNKIEDNSSRLYYLLATARFGWSRNVLLNQIKACSYERSRLEKKSHNFPAALPEHLAEQAEEALKSSYNLEFLGIKRAIKERDLEDRLLDHLRDFILELGYGFCFVGRQYRIKLGKKEYAIDLLFYHRFLKTLVAIDLKLGAFEPEHSGKMDFYLNVLNETERAPGDAPSIGIILCAEKDGLEVEFALKSKVNPIGVAEYSLRPKLPSEFKGKLPTGKQLTDALREELQRP